MRTFMRFVFPLPSQRSAPIWTKQTRASATTCRSTIDREGTQDDVLRSLRRSMLAAAPRHMLLLCQVQVTRSADRSRWRCLSMIEFVGNPDSSRSTALPPIKTGSVTTKPQQNADLLCDVVEPHGSYIALRFSLHSRLALHSSTFAYC